MPNQILVVHNGDISDIKFDTALEFEVEHCTAERPVTYLP